MSTDAELGALVRRMPKESALYHGRAGIWSYQRGIAGPPTGFVAPEYALATLQQFVHHWLHYYENGQLSTPAAREDLYGRAMKEVSDDPN